MCGVCRSTASLDSYYLLLRRLDLCTTEWELRLLFTSTSYTLGLMIWIPLPWRRAHPAPLAPFEQSDPIPTIQCLIPTIIQ